VEKGLDAIMKILPTVLDPKFDLNIECLRPLFLDPKDYNEIKYFRKHKTPNRKEEKTRNDEEICIRSVTDDEGKKILLENFRADILKQNEDPNNRQKELLEKDIEAKIEEKVTDEKI